MSSDWQDVAREALAGAESGTMSFPEIVRSLIEAGCDGYAVDFRRAAHTYYGPAGETVELKAHRTTTPVAEPFDAALIRAAIREAQAGAPGYTYRGFCDTMAKAGCAGYLVSFPGRRVLYYGRTGEAHTEHFPGAQP